MPLDKINDIEGYVESLNPEELAKLPVEDLAELNETIAERLTGLQTVRKKMQLALIARYEERYRELARVMRKDNGVIHISDGAYDVAMSIDKKVTWNQPLLERIYTLKALSYGDTSLLQKSQEYIEVKYWVSESSYGEAPEEVQDLLRNARTVGEGSVKFDFRPLKKESK